MVLLHEAAQHQQSQQSRNIIDKITAEMQSTGLCKCIVVNHQRLHTAQLTRNAARELVLHLRSTTSAVPTGSVQQQSTLLC